MHDQRAGRSFVASRLFFTPLMAQFFGNATTRLVTYAVARRKTRSRDAIACRSKTDVPDWMCAKSRSHGFGFQILAADQPDLSAIDEIAFRIILLAKTDADDWQKF